MSCDDLPISLVDRANIVAGMALDKVMAVEKFVLPAGGHTFLNDDAFGLPEV